MKPDNYYSKELYEYYKHWLNTSIHAYRNSTPNTPAATTWLTLSHRASCLTDLYLRLSKQYENR